MTFGNRRFGQPNQNSFPVPVWHIAYAPTTDSEAATASFRSASMAKTRQGCPNNTAATANTIPITSKSTLMLIANLQDRDMCLAGAFRCY
jgi:hypothetical protein